MRMEQPGGRPISHEPWGSPAATSSWERTWDRLSQESRNQPAGGPFAQQPRERKTTGMTGRGQSSLLWASKPGRATWLPSAQATLGHNKRSFWAERTKNHKWEIRPGHVHQASRRQDSRASRATSHSPVPHPWLHLPARMALFTACWSQWQIFYENWGGGGGDGGGGEGVTAPSLPSEGVPDHQQAVGPSVSRGDPPPVLADAHAGDHVGVALRKPGGSSFKTWRMQPSPGIGRKDWGPAESRAPSPTHRAGNSTSRRQVPYVVATCLGPRHNSEC